MTRLLAIASLAVFGIVGLAFGSQDERRLSPLSPFAHPLLGGKLPPKADPKTPDESPDAIIKRIKDGFNDTQRLLDSNNPGDETQRLQKQIIDNLGRLLNQQDNKQDNNSRSASPPPASSQQDSRPDNAPKPGTPKASPTTTPKAMKDPAPASPSSNVPKEGPTANTAKPVPPPPSPKPLIAADAVGQDWARLPFRNSQEMDAYARERFMRKHEQTIREYYRSITSREPRE